MSQTKIMSRWDRQKVLYVAEGAADIREALEAARKNDADLRGANLRDADLGGANLRGANLRDANLWGANLWGANLRPDLWSEVVDILQRALSEISITGHWIKGKLSKTLESGEHVYCAIGAVRKEGEGTALVVASWLLAQVSGGSVESFNDAEETTLEDVQAVFEVAIMHARRWAGTAKAVA